MSLAGCTLQTIAGFVMLASRLYLSGIFSGHLIVQPSTVGGVFRLQERAGTQGNASWQDTISQMHRMTVLLSMPLSMKGFIFSPLAAAS